MTHDPDYRVMSSGMENIMVELMPDSENLFTTDFDIDNKLLVFGPEDGSVPKTIRQHCKRFIQIPSLHCFNLASAATIVMTVVAMRSGLFEGQASQFIMESERRHT